MDTTISSNESQHQNLFLQQYKTPHQVVPFDLIEETDFKPAILKGIAEEDAEIENIINNPEPPSFENTILSLQHTGKTLGRVQTVMSNLLSACTSDFLENLAQEMTPALIEHSTRIMYNEKLFERVKAVKNSCPKLTHEEQKLLDNTYDGFVKLGIGLSMTKKEKLQALNQEKSLLQLQFSQNVLKDTNRYKLHITNKEELSGLPELQMELAHDAAKQRDLEGWLFTLQQPSFAPVLTYCDNRSLRKRIYVAHSTLCIKNNRYNNLAIVRNIVNIRLQSAKLLGYKTHAQRVLKYRMAKNPAKVEKFLNELLIAYKPTAIADYEKIEQYAKKVEGSRFRLQPWDVAYYSHKLQLEKYNFDAEMLRPYFELSKVIKGVFGLATRLYGITFKENSSLPVYHKDVVAYEVYDNDGQYLAILYVDFYPRDNKKSGAWMTSYQGQWIEPSGENIRPHVSLCMNFTKPTETKPSLLTLGEVSTFLHEFGHGLHEIFSQCHFESLSGTNVYWDFVELPSQFMENYALEKEFLHTFAFHYETNEPIPDELVDRVISSRHYNAGLGCLRQLSFGLLDMAYHTLTEPLSPDIDIIEFEKQAWAPAIIGNQPKLRKCMTTHFGHIMAGGYSAGYYSYKWAEVLDADAYSAFQEEGIFNQQTARRFRQELLSKGATYHPSVLFKNFRHRNPSIKAMLNRDGIKVHKNK